MIDWETVDPMGGGDDSLWAVTPVKTKEKESGAKKEKKKEGGGGEGGEEGEEGDNRGSPVSPMSPSGDNI
jgi:hypothetical protein